MSKKILILLLFLIATFFTMLLIPLGNSILNYAFDSCENTGNWNTIFTPSGTLCTIAPSASTFKEGIGALKFSNYLNNSVYTCSTTSRITQALVQNGTKVFGAWLNLFNLEQLAHIGIRVYIDANNCFGISLVTQMGHGYPFTLEAIGEYNLGGSSYALSSGTLGMGWHWVEMQWIHTTNNVALYCDGVGVLSFSWLNLDVSSWVFQVKTFGSDTGNYTTMIDYARVSYTSEYPPSDPSYNLTINALNSANNSSISVPMKINDVEYYTPIAASLTSGIYIVQPEDYGFNTTHYWRFVNWTDNADRTRTINFTGPASYTAYYQLAKIQSWGGYFNFFLGLAGLGMMASSWFVLKWQWDEKNYGVAILTWMLLLIVGFALCTILFGG